MFDSITLFYGITLAIIIFDVIKFHFNMTMNFIFVTRCFKFLSFPMRFNIKLYQKLIHITTR